MTRGFEMKNLVVTKGTLVEAPAEDKAEGVVAYQVVHFSFVYFGASVETTHDTKIIDDGRQLVIGGDGFIPHGYEVK